ncbi:hypothetical protein AAE478_001567 [Parahypoxylon ruwenzoriense]
MAPTKYHRFRSGERCDECGARQWYAQDAIRYCRNGHRLEGFAEHEEDEDAFGTRGKVTRRKKEPRRKAAVKLAGDEARELYLEALQLVLLRLVRRLLHHLEFPPDLEEVVRALWALRVRNLPLREVGANREGGKRGGGGDESDGYGSSATAPFSSFSEGGTGDDESDLNFSDAATAVTATWAPGAGRRWKLPKLIDTLALCYLGCLVRRLPVTTADFCYWAQRGDLGYLAALNDIPRNVRDRLPAEYHRALQIRDHIPLGRLQATVQELVISFKTNFDMAFPPLNYVPVLVRFITELVLPAEIYPTVKCITEILKADYSYPTGGRKIRTMDNPEVLLIALVVLSAKLLYPLDGVERPPRIPQDPRSMKVDWTEWQRAMQDDTAEASCGLARGEEHKVTPEDVFTMNNEKLDDFMDWFEKMWIGDGDLKTDERIREPFGGQKRPTTPGDQNKGGINRDTEEDSERLRKRFRVLNDSMVVVEPIPDEDTEDAGEKEKKKKEEARDLCPVWRSEEDLPDAARGLYGKAASLAAIPLNTLIRGVGQVERRLEVWCIQRAKRERDKGKRKGKGKGKAARTDDDELESDEVGEV